MRSTILAAVVVIDASAAARFAFYPRSHLVPVPEADGSPVAAMDRVAAELRLRGLDRQTLQATVGDVWLGHPRLMRGSLGAVFTPVDGSSNCCGSRQGFNSSTATAPSVWIGHPLAPCASRGTQARSISSAASTQPV